MFVAWLVRGLAWVGGAAVLRSASALRDEPGNILRDLALVVGSVAGLLWVVRR